MDSYLHNQPLKGYLHAVDAAQRDQNLVAAIERAAIHLDAEGYAVVPQVLARSLCDQLHAQFWQSLQETTEGRLWRPQVADDLAQFRVGGNWPNALHGIFQDGHFSHLPLVHEIRAHPRVQLVFALLYGCGERLVSSVDRVNYQLPAEWLHHMTPKKAAYAGHVAEASWLHVDQAINKHGRWCIQGLVNLEDTDQDGDASLELVPRSHLWHEQLPALSDREYKGADASIDWIKFPDEVRERINAKTGLINQFTSVRAKKGDMILWDSRTWHQGGRIRACAEAPRDHVRPRFVVYTCFQPLDPALAALPVNEVVKRQRLFQEHKAAAHWPLKTKVFGPVRTYGKAPEELPYFNFSRHVYTWDELSARPVLMHTYGLSFEPRINLLSVLGPRKPLLDFVRPPLPVPRAVKTCKTPKRKADVQTPAGCDAPQEKRQRTLDALIGKPSV